MGDFASFGKSLDNRFSTGSRCCFRPIIDIQSLDDFLSRIVDMQDISTVADLVPETIFDGFVSGSDSLSSNNHYIQF
jgi:hypothetical protein